MISAFRFPSFTFCRLISAFRFPLLPAAFSFPLSALLSMSIITAVRNGAATIGHCRESVRRQALAAEHVVVDGQSSDATLEILRAQSGPGLVVVSEPDRGVYDAMNKGITRATGDILGILNADDLYASPQVLPQVAAVFEDPAVDSAYGDVVYVRASTGAPNTGEGPLGQRDGEFVLPEERPVRHWTAGKMRPRSFWWGWMPPHPAFFVRRRVYEKLGRFRLDLGTSADYELMLRFLVKHRITTRYIPETLVKMRVGGISNASWRNRLAANRNDRRAWAVNELRPFPWTLWMKPLRKLPQWMCRP